MLKRLKTKGKSSIPVQLSEDEFDEFILKHLLEKVQKHHYQVSRYKIFNYILKFCTRVVSGRCFRLIRTKIVVQKYTTVKCFWFLSNSCMVMQFLKSVSIRLSVYLLGKTNSKDSYRDLSS